MKLNIESALLAMNLMPKSYSCDKLGVADTVIWPWSGGKGDPSPAPEFSAHLLHKVGVFVGAGQDHQFKATVGGRPSSSNEPGKGFRVLALLPAAPTPCVLRDC